MAKNREIIQIHIGQAGNQIASPCWQLYCLEQGICPDGTFYRDSLNGENCSAFFKITKKGTVIPRVLLIDLEPNVIDKIRSGPYRKLFPTNSLITGKEDAASNFARGKLTLGSEWIEVVKEKLKFIVEECSSIQGFMLFRALGGGTGSGFGSLIAEHLQLEYPKVPKFEFDVFPSPKISPLIVEPYNAVLGVHDGLETIDCSVLFDNEALYDICGRGLGVSNVNYSNLNRIVAQTVSCATASLRFSGDINVDLAELQTNLVPYQRIHFPVTSYAPIYPRITGGSYDSYPTSRITSQVFDEKNQLIKCNPCNGKYMSCCLFYRGNVSGVEINQAIHDIKERHSKLFVDWSPASFKIGINSRPPVCIPGTNLAHSDKAVCMMSNNTAVRVVWQRLMKKFKLMHSKKAFVHHFISEGLEEFMLAEASENISTLIDDYKEIEADYKEEFSKPTFKSELKFNFGSKRNSKK